MTPYPTTPLRTATVGDLAWLAGAWQGSKAGDIVEEHWSSPAGNAMMGMFRWLRADAARFYELMTLEMDDDAVILRIKHFQPKLIGWEEKDAAVSLVLVQISGEEAVFSKRDTDAPRWLVYRRRTSEDTLTAFFTDGSAPPTPDDEFRYARQAG